MNRGWIEGGRGREGEGGRGREGEGGREGGKRGMELEQQHKPYMEVEGVHCTVKWNIVPVAQ